MRIASSMRSTPRPVMLAVSSAWLKLRATNEMAPRLYTSSGCTYSSALTSDGRSARSPGTGSTNGNSSRIVVEARVVLTLDHPEHVVALAVEELGEVLAVLSGDPGDERSGHGAAV